MNTSNKSNGQKRENYKQTISVDFSTDSDSCRVQYSRSYFALDTLKI